MSAIPPEPMNAMMEARGALGLVDLAPGVQGYMLEADGAIYIPLIEAEEPGSGAVAEWLDSLPRDRTIKIPDVISSKLREMLLRRGFRAEMEYAPEFEEDVEVMVRRG